MRLPGAAALLLALRFLAAIAGAAPAISVQPQDKTIGSGENAALSVTAPGATSYQWFKGAAGDTSAPVPGATGPLCITLPLYAGGQFWVQASDANGSTASRTVELNISSNIPGRLMGMGDNQTGQLGGSETMYRATPLPIANGVTRMDSYGSHTLYIKEDSTLWALGYNVFGQLGDGSSTERNSPFQVPSGGPVAQVAAGDNHSLFLRADGTAWAMGNNGSGQLGIGSNSSKNTPQQVMTGAVQVAAGEDHSFFLKTDGTLWAAGENDNGQYGNGSTTLTNTPTQVASGVAAVATRYHHTLILKTDGTLWGAGYNGYAQLGDGSITQRNTPVAIASGVSFCAAGTYHSIFRKADGTWWAMGENGDGELGDGTTTRRYTPVSLGTGIRQASAGLEASLWVKDDGLVRAMGLNDNGQAGIGNLNALPAPQPILTSHRALRVVSAKRVSLFLDASPSFTTQPADVVVMPGQAASLAVAPAEGADVTYQWYRGASGDTSQAAGTGISLNVAAPVADASYWVRISNAYGSSDSRTARVIIASSPSIQTPPAGTSIAAGEGVALRVQASGGGLAYQWYRGATGDTSAPLTGATAELLVVPPLYATQSYWVRVSNLAGSADSSAATITVAPAIGATLRGCGWNASNQILGSNSLSRPYPEVCSTGVIAFDAGSRASHFITTDHTLWERGNNTNTLNQHGTDVIAVSGGEAFALFIKQDLSAWGVRTNDYGQLGDGTTTSRKTPVQVATNVARVSAGQYFSFFVKTDGSLWATGKNDHGHFGNGTWENSLAPIYITSGVVDAVAGDYQGFFLKADGTLWGMGDAYTLGIGVSNYLMHAVPVQIASGVSRISGTQGYTLFLKTDGRLWSTDPFLNSYQAVQVATGVAKFAAGGSHAIFTKTDGSLWGVGWNAYGQLGNGSTSGTASTPVPISTDVLNVSAGSNHSLFTDLRPGFTTHPFSGFVATGTTTTLSVAGIGTGTLTYQWYRGDRGDTSQPLPGETATTYTTPVLTSDARYWVRVTDARGSWDSLTGVLTVVSVPQITTPPVTPAALAYGASASMSVGVTGLGLTIQWYRGQPGDTSSPIAGASGNLLVTPPLTGNTSFWVRTSNAAGTVESAAVPVTLSSVYPSVLRSTGSNSKGQLGNGSTSTSITTSFTGIGMPAVAVAAGGSHSLFLKDDGSLWAMGENNVGQLGDDSFTPKNSPVKVADDVAQITAGLQHSMFVKKDGTLWGMGYNSDGRLGLSSSSQSDIPRQITTGVAQVSAGDDHTLYLTTSGRLLSAGSNTYGQRGNVLPSITTGVVKIAAGGKYSLVLKSDGTVWAMGLNIDGQLGDGSLTNRTTPVQVAADLAGGIRVVDIAAGGRHSLLLRSDGSVWTCGANNYGQAGLGSATRSSTWTQITSIPAGTANAIAAGADHSFILRNNGALYASGRNQFGQLGDGGVASRTVFSQVATGITRAAGGGSHSLVAAAAPVILAQSLDTGAITGQTPTLSVTVGGMPNFTYKWYHGSSGDTSQQIAGATAASYVTPPFTVDASYWVRITGPGGAADSQTMRVLAVTQPGITTQPQAIPGLIGMPAELSVTVSGGVPSFQWYYGNPGDTSSPVPGGNSALLRTPRLTASVSVWVRVTNAAGTVDSQSAFITAAPGQLVTMGARSFGQLGDGGTFEYPTPRQVASGAAKIRSSGYASFVLKTDGTLWGAGSVNWSEEVSSSTNAFVQLASNIADFQSGRNFHIFLKTDGTLWAYGAVRAYDEDPRYHWDAPFQVASGVTAISAGDGHYLYLTADGTLRGAGDNFWGQLSADDDIWEYGTPVVVATGVVHTCAGSDTTFFVKADGSLWGQGWDNGALGVEDSPPDGVPVQIATGVSRVFADYHTFFLKTDGSLWATGSNGSGQLGDGTNTRRTTPAQIATGVVSAAPGYYHSIFLKGDGSLWAMGRNLRGELGTGDYAGSNVPVQVATGVADLAAGYDFSLFTDTQGRVWAMGSNSYGQFGLEEEFFRKEPEILTGPVTQVATSASSYFIRGDGSLWAMGANDAGQLGDGSYRYRYTPVPVAEGVKKVSPGGNHTLFIKDDDSLWGMGSNAFNPLGNASSGGPLPIRIAGQVQDIAAGSDYSLFVKKDGSLWGMGRNWDYQVGLPSNYDYVPVPTQVATGVSRVASGGSHSLYLKLDGTLWAMGQNLSGQTGIAYPWSTYPARQLASAVVDFAAGWNHSVWIDTAGTLWGVGDASYGQLGTLPDSAYQTATPVVIAAQVARVWAIYGSTLFLKKDGTLWGLGNNYTGILGDTGEVYEGVPQFIASGVATASAGGDNILFVTIGPVITRQPEAVTIALGSGAEFSVAAAGNGPLTYQWFRGLRGDTSQPVSGATSASFSAPPATTAVNYWVRVSNPFAHTDSNTAVLAVAGSGAPHYQSWAIAKGISDLARGADPDHDGLSNYMEYFFNTDPLATSPGATPVPAADSEFFTITFRRLRGSNAEYLPLWSPDLASWDEPETWYWWVADGDADGDGTTQLITISRPIAAGENRGFLKLEISEP